VGAQLPQLWDVTNPAQPSTIGQSLSAGHGAVDSVAFSPDGHTLASGSNDGTVRLWDVTNPAQPSTIGQPLTGHTDTVYSVAFSPDGHTLATGSTDGTGRLWDLNVDHAIQRICATTHNTLTRSKWKQYIADLPYDPPCRPLTATMNRTWHATVPPWLFNKPLTRL
jgi:WD40 repeat protein